MRTKISFALWLLSPVTSFQQQANWRLVSPTSGFAPRFRHNVLHSDRDIVFPSPHTSPMSLFKSENDRFSESFDLHISNSRIAYSSTSHSDAGLVLNFFSVSLTFDASMPW